MVSNQFGWFQAGLKPVWHWFQTSLGGFKPVWNWLQIGFNLVSNQFKTGFKPKKMVSNQPKPVSNQKNWSQTKSSGSKPLWTGFKPIPIGFSRLAEWFQTNSAWFQLPGRMVSNHSARPEADGRNSDGPPEIPTAYGGSQMVSARP